MKKILKKYRSVVVIGTALVFNLTSSLLVWKPEGVILNLKPMTVVEWICDIISIVWFFAGFIMMFFDIHENEKQKIKEAILETNEELKNDEDAILAFKTTETN